MSTSRDRYIFDTGDPVERQRLDAHAELWDPCTFRRLAATGVGAGWRCLDVGAGTGTVARWLADQVGPGGVVVATDLETAWLADLVGSADPAGAAVVVRRHDIVDEPLDALDDAGGGYDLVHARLLLEHLPEREAVVGKLAAALRPGGWMVVEDYDLRTMALSEPALPAWDTVSTAVVEALRGAGVDPLYGIRIAPALRAAGLVDVTTDGVLRPATIPELAAVFRPALQALREPLLRLGTVTAGQLAEVLAAFDDHTTPTTTYTPILVAATGRRPHDETHLDATTGG